MHLAVVACGNRLDETLTMVKSALLFSLKRIKFHIFAEDPLAPLFEERVRLLHWLDTYKRCYFVGLFSLRVSSVSHLTCDLIRRLLNTPSPFVIDDIKIRAVLTLPLCLALQQMCNPIYLKAEVWCITETACFFSAVCLFKVTFTEEPDVILITTNTLLTSFSLMVLEQLIESSPCVEDHLGGVIVRSSGDDGKSCKFPSLLWFSSVPNCWLQQLNWWLGTHCFNRSDNWVTGPTSPTLFRLWPF